VSRFFSKSGGAPPAQKLLLSWVMGAGDDNALEPSYLLVCPDGYVAVVGRGRMTVRSSRQAYPNLCDAPI
jgi:hypothetical protein